MKKLILAILGIGSMLMVVSIGIWKFKYLGRVYPGIKIANVYVGGSTYEEAQQKLKREMNKMTTIKLVWGTSRWNIPVQNIDLVLDAKGSIDATRNVGWGTNLAPEFSLDENQLVAAIASVSGQIDIPAREPEISIQNGQVQVSTGENGQEVDEQKLVVNIKEAIKNLNNNEIEVPVVLLLPKLTDAQVVAVKSKAEKLLGKKIILNFPDINQTWEVNQDQLVTWVAPDKISSWVTQLAETVDRPPQDATFKWLQSGNVQEFSPAKPGFAVNQKLMSDKLIEAVDKLTNGETSESIPVEVVKTKPKVDTGDVNDLGIRELLGQGESWFSGSITNRIFNVQKAAALMNGVLVAPGEEFSFNQHLGDVSAATGFKQAYVIKDGKTVLGDGGGVCQVSTTLFRAVLKAGMPIDERTAHAYRVSYYEEGGVQPGFDATVFEPAPDFKFKNDTPAYILIQTDFDETNKHLIFNLYGTSDGRVANVSKAKMWDVTPPPPDLYQDDPTLPVGKVVQTEHAAWGSKVSFDWKVIRGEEVLQDRTFYSNYQPWQAVYLRGTKTN